MRNGIIQFLLIFCAVSLLFFPQTSIDGAKNGLLLWSATITPTLLPFLLLSGFMQYYQTFHFLSRLFFPLKKLFPDINDDFFYTCILGFFCGCPLGAKIINDLILSGSYTKQEGQALLYVCNQISPMFTIGYTLTLILHGNINTLCFFFCLYFNFSLQHLLIYHACKQSTDYSNLFYLFFTKDFLHAHQISHPVSIKKSADQIIFDSLHSIFTIGICIMIFSIGASLISVLPFPFFIKQVLIAIFEITNAVSYFGTMQISSYHKIILLCMITSFGGLSAAAQTISVCKKSRLSFWKYLLVKFLFSLSSGLLAALFFI